MAIKKISISILISVVNTLANIEFNILTENGIQYSLFRKIYLKLMGVKFSTYRFGKHVYIKEKGNLNLGQNVRIGSFTKIWNYSLIEIGDDFLAAGSLTLNTGTHDVNTLEAKSESIKIGKNVWCGVNVTILSGVTIGNNCVIGAGAVVTKNIPDNSVAVGIPAKVIKEKE
ncbi:acyltransferase [Pedobacter sp.]